MNRLYLSVEDILDIHDDQIDRYGGSGGIRDKGALEAAAARPQLGYYDGVVDEAAALWESLSQNHPFVDGNKRTAFSSMNRFLLLNDIEITANNEDTYIFIMDAFDRQDVTFNNLSQWLHANTRPSWL